MKTLIAAVCAVLVSSSAYAGNLTFGGDVKAQHKVDAENTQLILTPKATYYFGMLTDLEVSTDLKLYNDEYVLNSTLDTKPTIDFAFTHVVDGRPLELEAKTSYNLESEDRGEVTLTATWSF